MKNIVVCISLLLASAVGCRVSKPSRPEVISKDSTIIIVKTIEVEKVRDSLVYVNDDEANLQALLECDSTGQVLLKQLQSYKAGIHAKVPAFSIKNNVLDIKNQVDSFSVYLHWKEKFTSTDTTTFHDKLVTITIRERIRYKTWLDKALIKTGLIALILLVIIGGFKLFKNRFAIITKKRKWVA